MENAGDGAVLTSENDDKVENNEEMKLVLQSIDCQALQPLNV